MSRLTQYLLSSGKARLFFCFFVLLLFFYFRGRINDYLTISAIEDSSSELIHVYDDGALSIGGLKMKDRDREKYRKEKHPNRWYLKNDRKLTTEEYNCLTAGLFSAAIVDDYLDIICLASDNENTKVLYIR